MSSQLAGEKPKKPKQNYFPDLDLDHVGGLRLAAL